MYLLLVKYLGYLYIIRNSNWIVLAVTNSLNKNRYCPGFFMGLFTWMSMNFIFIYTSWYNLMGIEIENISILNGIVIQIVSGILLSIQYYYGSRFFLPKRYRSYAYNYERIISGNIKLKTINLRFLLYMLWSYIGSHIKQLDFYVRNSSASNIYLIWKYKKLFNNLQI